MKKPIDIKNQPTLTLGRTVHITVNGIRYRLFRSSVTVVVITVAIAFLMNVLSESIVKRAVISSTKSRIADLRLAAAWASQLSTPENMEEILLKIASAASDDPICLEAAKMGGVSSQEMNDYWESAKLARSYRKFFSELNYGRRRALVHRASGIQILDHLQDPNNWNRFSSALETMKSVRFISSLDEFQEFLRKWPIVRETTLRIQKGREAAIAQVTLALQGKPVLQALTEIDGPFGQTLRQAGFILDQESAAKIVVEAKRMQDMNALKQTISNKDIRSKLAGYLDITTGEVDAQKLWTLLRNRQAADWFFKELTEGKALPEGITLERIKQLAQLEGEERSLGRTEQMAAIAEGGLFGMGERMTWLVLASMMVCVVGISNAMLMSVTERFREIATLKCLGALDGFIMLMFVLEASFLGVVGALAGAISGSILGLLRMFIAFRGLLASSIPFESLFIAIGVSVVLGVILAALASIYPSFKAARLAPMEAMRIE